MTVTAREVNELVESAKSDAIQLQTSFISLSQTAPLLNTLTTNITNHIQPQLSNIQTQISSTYQSAKESSALKELNRLGNIADKYLDSVESTLATCETFVTDIGIEFIGALTEEGVTGNTPDAIKILQNTYSTFSEDPVDLPQWPEYLEQFDIETHQSKIDALLEIKKISEITKPILQSASLIWARYFFKVNLVLEAIERRKRVLDIVKTRDKNIDIELTWDDDEESPVKELNEKLLVANETDTLIPVNVETKREEIIGSIKPDESTNDVESNVILSKIGSPEIPQISVEKGEEKGEEWEDDWE